MLYTQAELARELGVKEATVNARVYRGQIPEPTHTLGSGGKRRYYSEAEVKKLVRDWQPTKQQNNVCNMKGDKIDQDNKSV